MSQMTRLVSSPPAIAAALALSTRINDSLSGVLVRYFDLKENLTPSWVESLNLAYAPIVSDWRMEVAVKIMDGWLDGASLGIAATIFSIWMRKKYLSWREGE